MYVLWDVIQDYLLMRPALHFPLLTTLHRLINGGAITGTDGNQEDCQRDRRSHLAPHWPTSSPKTDDDCVFASAIQLVQDFKSSPKSIAFLAFDVPLAQAAAREHLPIHILSPKA